jgi:hypothetical protein
MGVSGKDASVGEGQFGGRAAKGARPALRAVPAGEGVRKRRASRSATLPPPPEDRTLDYAASREELRGIEPGEVVLAVERLRGFREVVRPALEAADAARLAPKPGEKKRRGQRPSFHALDYWRLEMLRRVLASHSTQHTRDWLTTDKAARTRELLGFEEARTHYGGKPKRWRDGVPSDGWMSDFRTKWMSEAELAELMAKLEKWALAEKMATLPEMREECRTLHADGSKLETHATPPHLKKDKDGNVIGVLNEWKKGRDGKRVPAITAPEAGFIPNDGRSGDHSGSGWNIVMVMSSKGTVLAHRNVPLHASESGTLAEMAPEVGQVLDALGEPELRVLTTDCAFHSHGTRRALRGVGIVENTHLSSHSNGVTARREAKRRTVKRYLIDGHPNWFATGHREVVCRCEQGKTARVCKIGAGGTAVARVKGECAECGSILITSGLWRLSKNEKFVKCLPSERSSKAEFDFGNPLTYHDDLAREYGRQRFHGQEGTFGSQFTQRWKLLKSKRWFYRQTQVDLEVAAVVTITHALSLERWRRAGLSAGAAAVAASPPEALAA